MTSGDNQVTGRDLVELADGKAKALGDLPKKLLFLPMDFPVGFCDVEKTVKHILKQLAIALKQGDELFSTGLKVDCVPLGRIERRGDLLHQCGRHLKRLLEGFNLDRKSVV